MAEAKWERVRFLKDAPSFIGVDFNVYGPFKSGTIAYTPAQNASSLIKQGIAELAREVAEKPTLKQMFKGEVLTPFAEAQKSLLLTELAEERKVSEVEKKREKLIERAERLLKEARESV